MSIQDGTEQYKLTKNLTEDRVKLDSVLKSIKALPASRGASMAYTALEFGRMWMGEMCRELGKEYPYESTKTATNASQIVDAVDKADSAFEFKGNEIEQLNGIREYLDNVLSIYTKDSSALSLAPVAKEANVNYRLAFTNMHRGLKESRMALGLRLGELRDIEKANDTKK